jgi:acyl-CoA synthetase (AMP-forming)/AMP-acid ligase II
VVDREVVAAANDTAVPVRACLVDLVRRRGAGSSGPLWRAAWDVLARLRASAVRRGDRIAVIGGPDTATAAAVLGVWLAEATCVPVPAGWPGWRVRSRVVAADVRVVLADAPGRWPGALPLAGESDVDDQVGLTPEAADLVPAFLLADRWAAHGPPVVYVELDRVADACADETDPLTSACLLPFRDTMAAFWATAGRVDVRGACARPGRNTTAVVLDRRGQRAPIGVPGHLHLAGQGIGHPAGSGDVFDGHLATGRLARWTDEGAVEILGWVGRHAVVDGCAVDLARVEAAVSERLAASAVVVVGAGDDVAGLVVVAVTDERPGVREELLAELGFLQDVRFEPDLPVGEDGHPDSDVVAACLRASRRQATGSSTLNEVMADFAALLPRADITPGTHFFKNGGHSLLGARLAHRTNERTGTRLRLADIFAHPTPSGLAELIASAGAATPGHDRKTTPEPSITEGKDICP